MIRELVVISGKGGTGKTSIAASLAVLAKKPLVADCDVDAADLHLLLAPRERERRTFESGRQAVIRGEACIGCGRCRDLCRYDAVGRVVTAQGESSYFVDPHGCEGCGVCARFCSAGAIDFSARVCGRWMVSDTRVGPMVHARLGIAAENSGKLVSLVRREAARLAREENRELVIVDGPPGVGCPVIASLTGAHRALLVAEPTVSGEHDLHRVLELASHFGIRSHVAVNKWDLNPDMTRRLEAAALHAGAVPAGRIRYDTGVTRAQIAGLTPVEADTPCAPDIVEVWKTLDLEK
jgi:MinD superfamily P-loop ATPase